MPRWTKIIRRTRLLLSPPWPTVTGRLSVRRTSEEQTRLARRGRRKPTIWKIQKKCDKTLHSGTLLLCYCWAWKQNCWNSVYVNLSNYQSMSPLTHFNEDGDFGQIGLPGALGEALKACGGSVCAVNGGEEGHWYSSPYNGQPHRGTHQCRVSACSDGAGAERVDYCQEAIYADAGEKEHAAVNVGDEGCSRYLTQSVPKWPVAVNIVKDLKWQRKNKY